MARTVGYEDLSTLNGLLTRLEREGVIVREVRGRRTYRITLAPEAAGRHRKRSRLPASASPSKGADLEEELCHPRSQLRLSLLLLLAQRPGHGYDLVERLRPFGYEHDDPAQTYRALHWLERVGLAEPAWDTQGPGPARRVFTITPAGRHAAERCAPTLRKRIRAIRAHLDGQQGTGPEEGCNAHCSFEVLIEARLSVDAADEVMARRKVDRAFVDGRALCAGVTATGYVRTYDATQKSGQG